MTMIYDHEESGSDVDENNDDDIDDDDDDVKDVLARGLRVFEPQPCWQCQSLSDYSDWHLDHLH